MTYKTELRDLADKVKSGSLSFSEALPKFTEIIQSASPGHDLDDTLKDAYVRVEQGRNEGVRNTVYELSALAHSGVITQDHYQEIVKSL